MNSASLVILENQRKELLEKYGLDSNSINEFKSKIKKVSKEESDALGKELFELISKNDFKDDYEKAIELIYNGANIEYKNEEKGDFSLLVCARRNYLKTFIALVKAGANVNQVNNYLTTATMGSARHGRKEILEILILMDADINARCLDGDNAMMSAKRHEKHECFNMLLNAQAYLNSRNIVYWTFLEMPGEVKFDSSMIKDSSVQKETSPKIEQDPFSLIEEAKKKLKEIS